MKHKLYLKFIGAYALLALVAVFIIASLGSQLIENHLISVTADSFYEQASRLSAEQTSVHFSSSELDKLRMDLTLLADSQDADIRIIAANGNVVIDTGSSRVDSSYIIEDFDYARFGPLYYEISTFFGEYRTDHLNVMVPITSGFTTRGYISFSTSMNSIDRQRDDLLGIFYIVSAVNFALSLLILALFTLIVYHPLQKIADGAREFSSGNLSHKIDVSSNDEMGYLADTLNVMAQDLKKSSDYQKKFISNVSHDFRSPLTSIKGFAEAMTDGTIPPELHERYLKIISSETDRLVGLTRDVLALNSMDTNKAVLTYTDFDINAMLKETAALFEGSCRKKKISINLVMSGESLRVNADLEKIQQVVYNLLDNAVKFSDRNTSIKLETSERHGKCYVSVKDEGCGIPAGELSHVWERFYKGDPSRGKDRKGTGLGLAIVKEIIQAHGQTITVTSTENVGTEFVFTLNLAKA